jgi:GNAT superfamily N-acetyltransferase
VHTVQGASGQGWQDVSVTNTAPPADTAAPDLSDLVVGSVPDASSGAALHVQHVAWDDPRALALRSRMDVEMNERYGDPGVVEDPAVKAARDAVLRVHPEQVHATVLVTDEAGRAVAHAVLRDLDGEWEIKRVIVDSAERGRGLGRLLMAELEAVARAGGAPRLILQTGDRQPEAVRLYERVGYARIPTYEPYVDALPNSICFEKPLV